MVLLVIITLKVVTLTAVAGQKNQLPASNNSPASNIRQTKTKRKAIIIYYKITSGTLIKNHSFRVLEVFIKSTRNENNHLFPN